MDSICNIVERLDEILNELEDHTGDDDLHLAIELGNEFRDELNSFCDE